MTVNRIKLGDVFRVGSSKRVLQSQWTTKGVPFYRGREITTLAEVGFVDNELYISEELFSEYRSKSGVPEAGDIMVTAIGTIGNSFVVRPEDRFYFKDASVLWLHRTAEVSSEFINYWLKSSLFLDQLDRGNGATVDTLTIQKLKNVQIELPGIDEQRRIIAILDEAFEGIATAKANAEKNLQNARELFDGYLQSVFEKQHQEWDELPLETVTSIVNGFAFKSGDFSPSGETKCIKITNVGVREFVCESGGGLPKQFSDKFSSVAIPAGSIVMALTRTIISNGLKVAVVPSDYNNALLNQRVAAILPRKGGVLLQFLFAYLSSEFVVKYVTERVNTLMQPNLSIADLRSMPIPMPSFPQQEKITELIASLTEETQRLESIYRQKLTALNDLKKSLLHQAFSGQL